MKEADYSEFVKSIAKQLGDPVQDRLHAAVGVAGEAGELLDQIKKNWVYNRELDLENVIEELGDIEFYMQHLRNLIDVPHHVIIGKNMEKLLKRYPNAKYSDTAANARADKNG